MVKDPAALSTTLASVVRLVVKPLDRLLVAAGKRLHLTAVARRRLLAKGGLVAADLEAITITRYSFVSWTSFGYFLERFHDQQEF